jgi:hypothetical protein
LPRSSASWANRCARVKLADLVAYGETLEQFAPASRARKLGALKSLAGFGHRIGYLAFDIGIGAPLRLPAVKATLAERILGLCQVSSLLEQHSRAAEPPVQAASRHLWISFRSGVVLRHPALKIRVTGEIFWQAGPVPAWRAPPPAPHAPETAPSCRTRTSSRGTDATTPRAGNNGTGTLVY